MTSSPSTSSASQAGGSQTVIGTDVGGSPAPLRVPSGPTDDPDGRGRTSGGPDRGPRTTTRFMSIAPTPPRSATASTTSEAPVRGDRRRDTGEVGEVGFRALRPPERRPYRNGVTPRPRGLPGTGRATGYALETGTLLRPAGEWWREDWGQHRR